MPKYKKSDLKNMALGRVLSIINAPANLEEEKNKKIDEIEKMNMMEYLKYLNEKENDEENEIVDEKSLSY